MALTNAGAGKDDYRGGVCPGNLNRVFIEIKERFGDRGDNGIRRHVRFLVPDEIAPTANPLINNVVSVGKTPAAKLCGRANTRHFLFNRWISRLNSSGVILIAITYSTVIFRKNK